MSVPAFIDAKVIDENGYWTDVWRPIMVQLINHLQTNISDEALVAPSQSDDNINFMTTGGRTLPNGSLIYDTTTNELKTIQNGIVKTITTS